MIYLKYSKTQNLYGEQFEVFRFPPYILSLLMLTECCFIRPLEAAMSYCVHLKINQALNNYFADFEPEELRDTVTEKMAEGQLTMGFRKYRHVSIGVFRHHVLEEFYSLISLASLAGQRSTKTNSYYGNATGDLVTKRADDQYRSFSLCCQWQQLLGIE